MKTFARVILMFVFVTALLVPQPQVVKAQDSCTAGSTDPGCLQPDGGKVDAQATAFMKSAYSVTLKGGYVAHGVGMRNLGYGTIVVNDVPANSTVAKAYLFWAVIGPTKAPIGFVYSKGKLNGVSITGSLIGSSVEPNWTLSDAKLWAYRADVTSKMVKGGNGDYVLTGFASGVTNGSAPNSGDALPMLEGASLVIVYKNALAPNTLIKILNGPNANGSSPETEFHLNVAKMNAFPPTGSSKTTFIVADGQNGFLKGPTSFFTTPLPVDFNGTDPNGNGVSYGDGNLWDTQTADLTNLIDAPELDFLFSVKGYQDSVAWVAQVVAYASGNQDSDGDGLKDGWEIHGVNGVNLPGYGADPLHKDLFVEADYMNGHDHRLDSAHLDDIVAVFNNAPVNNPDGTTGIHIHIDTGGALYGGGYNAAYDLGGGNAVAEDTNLGVDTTSGDYDWGEFQVLKDANFSANRKGLFHYMIFAHDLAPSFGSVSGISRNGWPDNLFIKGASDFIVSMGSWTSMGTQDQREGTFIHELGHNLGFRHGGNDHNNYKPNYLSVMNYSFQTVGVYRDGGYHYDYSRVLPLSLNENALSEAAALGASAANYWTKAWCPNQLAGYPNYDTPTWRDASAAIDWNCNGSTTAGTVKVNIDGSNNGISWTTPGYSTLGSQNNWASMTFLGGGNIGTLPTLGLGGVNALMVTHYNGELDFETNQRLEIGAPPR